MRKATSIVGLCVVLFAGLAVEATTEPVGKQIAGRDAISSRKGWPDTAVTTWPRRIGCAVGRRFR